MDTPTPDAPDTVILSRTSFDYLMGLAKVTAEDGPKIRIRHLESIQAEVDAS